MQSSNTENIALMFPRIGESFKAAYCFNDMMMLFPDSISSDFKEQLADGIPLSYLMLIMGGNPCDMRKVFESFAETLLLTLSAVEEENRRTLFGKHVKVYLRRRARAGDLEGDGSISGFFSSRLSYSDRLPWRTLVRWLDIPPSAEGFLSSYTQQIKKNFQQFGSIPAWFDYIWVKLAFEIMSYLLMANTKEDQSRDFYDCKWDFIRQSVSQIQEFVSLYYTEDERTKILSQVQ